MSSGLPDPASDPRIETERLVLDLHGVADFEPLAAMWGDAAVVRYIGNPSTPQESWMRLLRYRGLWPLLGYGYWCVRQRDNGRYVGDIGFADFHRDVEPSIRGVPEAGWVFARSAHGKGYASEALSAALAWFDRNRSHERCVCLIAQENGPSLRLAAAGGFVDARPATFNGQGTLLLERRLKHET